MLGIAVGCIGMSLDDFMSCTPTEIAAIHEQWLNDGIAREHAQWERARMMCMCMLQPYAKNTLSPRDVMVFPWELEGDGDNPKTNNTNTDNNLTRAEILAKFEEAKKAAGLK